jgi:predicted nuclease of predicted toxin-antitoxin system
MRFVIDTNVPRGLTRWLISIGHTAEHVLEIGLAQSHDQAIWRHAASAQAVIISKDEDFAILSRQDQAGPSVVWLRTGNGANAALIARLGPLWPAIVARLAAGDRLIEVR